MTELESLLIGAAVQLIEKIVTSIISSTSLKEEQKSAALAPIGQQLDLIAAKVAAVKFKDT